jgi:hypothetical protein
MEIIIIQGGVVAACRIFPFLPRGSWLGTGADGANDSRIIVNPTTSGNQ